MIARNPKYIKQHLITRFSDSEVSNETPSETERPATPLLDLEHQRDQGVRRLFKMAEVRKRQIIEKILMD